MLSTLSVSGQPGFPTTGRIERIDPAINEILSADAKAEIIATGFDWTEGPLWLNDSKTLLFSDIPRNTIYQWREGTDVTVYLTPSGYTGSAKRGGETGSNGLLLDKERRLVLCQHGDRRMAKMDATLSSPAPRFTTLADRYEGKRFNSPNDAVFHPDGDLYFTDPPYGLEGYIDDPTKELSYQGVYKVKADGTVVLLTDSLTRPNGLAFFPGGKTLVVGNSDPDKPNWYAFDVEEDRIKNGRIFYGAAGYDKAWKGGVDGLKIDSKGNVFATGPGGLWIFNSNGKLLGKLRLDEAASNVAFTPDEKTLYITNDMHVLRLKLR